MSGERRGRGVALAAAAALAAGCCALPGPATASARPDATVSAATVRVMVVGAGNVVLAGPRSINTAAVSVRAGGLVCGVAAGTPLAALADLRLAGGPGFALRDYGRCSSSPRASGQLFVYSLDGETNHGQNGWESTVDNRSGTPGAGDPSAAQGNARLLSAAA